MAEWSKAVRSGRILNWRGFDECTLFGSYNTDGSTYWFDTFCYISLINKCNSQTIGWRILPPTAIIAKYQINNKMPDHTVESPNSASIYSVFLLLIRCFGGTNTIASHYVWLTFASSHSACHWWMSCACYQMSFFSCCRMSRGDGTWLWSGGWRRCGI